MIESDSGTDDVLFPWKFEQFPSVKLGNIWVWLELWLDRVGGEGIEGNSRESEEIT